MKRPRIALVSTVGLKDHVSIISMKIDEKDIYARSKLVVLEQARQLRLKLGLQDDY